MVGTLFYSSAFAPSSSALSIFFFLSIKAVFHNYTYFSSSSFALAASLSQKRLPIVMVVVRVRNKKRTWEMEKERDARVWPLLKIYRVSAKSWHFFCFTLPFPFSLWYQTKGLLPKLSLFTKWPFQGCFNLKLLWGTACSIEFNIQMCKRNSTLHHRKKPIQQVLHVW